MGDIHVHTAPHAYEASGYAVWFWGDTTFSLLYSAVAVGEVGVIMYMHKQRETLAWSDSGGGHEWWRRKFIFLCALVPLTLLRACNLWMWAMFNGEAGSGFGDPKRIDNLKVIGDWLNALVFWYLLSIKALFLLTWYAASLHDGHIRWRNVYLQLGGVMSMLVLALGVPQAMVAHFGQICERKHQNDYCRKYHDTMSVLAVLQALVGLSLGVWVGTHFSRITNAETQGYRSIEAEGVTLVRSTHRDSYGSVSCGSEEGGYGYDGGPASSAANTNSNSNTQHTHPNTPPSSRSFAGAGAANMWPPPERGGESCQSDAEYRVLDSRKYTGVAACIFWSLVAHAALNVCFAWYAIGELGLVGNASLMALTILKLIAVELAPIFWLVLTIYADVSGAERVNVLDATNLHLINPDFKDASGGGGCGSGSVMATQQGAPAPADVSSAPPPPPNAYQIE